MRRLPVAALGAGLVLVGVVVVVRTANDTPEVGHPPLLVAVMSDDDGRGCTGARNEAGCTLREAVIVANERPGPDEIRLVPGVHRLSATGAAEDGGATGDLDITDDLTIVGGGAVVHATTGERVVDLHGGASLTLTDMEITGGTADEGDGGGIRVADGHLTIHRSTIAGNRAEAGGGGLAVETGSALVVSTTFSGNEAPVGGAMSNAGRLEVEWSTIKDNSGSTAGGIAGPATLVGTIVAEQAKGPGCAGGVTSRGFNVDGDGTCLRPGGTDDRVSEEPLGLGPLTDNGGFTRTHFLDDDSVAVGIGGEAGVDCPELDQRGLARSRHGDAGCDAGSTQSALPTVLGGVDRIRVIDAPPGTPVVVTGPGHRSSTPADFQGGVVVRDLEPADAYEVTIGSQSFSVAVTGFDAPAPDDRFYAEQALPPSDGYLETRDGTLLGYRFEPPDDGSCSSDRTCDLLITYSGYNPGLPSDVEWERQPFDHFTALGYAVVGVNMRGSGCSGGAFDVMDEMTALDGYDMVQAFGLTDWVDGVAMVDKSWPGLSQLFVASRRPPELDAIAAGAPIGDFYRDLVHPGGMENARYAPYWALATDARNAPAPVSGPLVSAAIAGGDLTCRENQALRGQNLSTVEAFSGTRTTIDTAAREGGSDAFWATRTADVASITVPTLMVVSWQDADTGSRAAALVNDFTSSPRVHLVGTNGGHEAYYASDVAHEVARFLDCYLRDSCPPGYVENPVALLFETDSAGRANQIVRSDHFETHGPGREFPIGDEFEPESPSESSTFVYDPPVAGAVGSNWPDHQPAVGFITEPLFDDVVMAGPGSVGLRVRTDGLDADLEVTLSEVRPDGQERLVQSGRLRLSHRSEDPERSSPLVPWHTHATPRAFPAGGVAETVHVELLAFAHVFRAGSRVRLTVSGPGGHVNASWGFGRIDGPFEITIEHDGSAATLPVVDPGGIDLGEHRPCDGDAVWMQPCRNLQLNVFETTDAVPGDCDPRASRECTLREAVLLANETPGTDTIVLQRRTYALGGIGGGDTAEAGDLDITDDLVVIGNGATIDGGSVDRVLDVHPDAQLTVVDTEIRGGHTADNGGGVRVFGRLLVRDSTISGNEAMGDGGGISFESGASGGLVNTTISGNRANTGGGLAVGDVGDGGSGEGVDVSWSTVTANAAENGGGVRAASAVSLVGTIVADQAAGADCAGTAARSDGYNLDTDGTCLGEPTPTDLPNQRSAGLGPLDLHDALTRTHMPGPDGPGVDRGPGLDGGCPVMDQRSRRRLTGADVSCDLGAVERPGEEPAQPN